MISLSWIGPTAMVAVLGYVYRVNNRAGVDHKSDILFPLRTRTVAFIFFIVYATGLIRRNRFFPSFFFQNNIFALLYRLYCSDLIGYRLLRGVMHQPTPYPHSDYRPGVRCLSDVKLARRKAVAKPGGRLSAAQALAADTRVGMDERGGGAVDLTKLGERESDAGILVVPVPLFSDNYAYLLISLAERKAVAVDPADPKMVLRALRSLSTLSNAPLQLTEVLTTHKHWDHAGGNATLLEYARQAEAAMNTESEDNLVSPHLAIIGSKVDHPMACTRHVKDGEVLQVAGGAMTVQVLASPGHTAGSIMFLVGESHAPAGLTQRTALFTGDTIFCGGCGAPFETTSVHQVQQTRRCFLDDARLRTHPSSHARMSSNDVLIYVGHEYTERLLTEVEGIFTARLRQAPSPEAQAFLAAVQKELVEVKELRRSSDGLQDASRMHESAAEASSRRTAGSTHPTLFTLPSCTVPSTLSVELRTNPFLTVTDAAISKAALKDGVVDIQGLEIAIYSDAARCMPVADDTKRDLN